MSSPDETNTGPVIRDLRRIDPVTGQVRDHGQAGPRGEDAKPKPGRSAAAPPGPGVSQAPAGGGPAVGEGKPAAGPGRQARGQAEAGEETMVETPAATAADAMADELAERTLDLQRVTAEYANYRKRVERDRIAVREQALANVLSGLLPVLDDIGRAREHGELVGGFKSVAESLEASVTKLGLTSFGAEGEPFDPNVHEALMHSYSPDVTEPACVRILQPGYRVGDRILRPARVAVAEPAEPADVGEPTPAEAGPAEAGPAGRGAGEPSPAEPGPAEAGPAEAGPAEAAPAEAGPAGRGAGEPGPAEPGPAEPGPAEPGQATANGNVAEQARQGARANHD